MSSTLDEIIEEYIELRRQGKSQAIADFAQHMEPLIVKIGERLLALGTSSVGHIFHIRHKRQQFNKFSLMFGIIFCEVGYCLAFTLAAQFYIFLDYFIK